MKRSGMMAILTLLLLGVASSRAGYEIASWTADGGGGTSTGGVFRVDGTAGQPDAGISRQTACAVSGGFWARVVEAIQAAVRKGTAFVVR